MPTAATRSSQPQLPSIARQLQRLVRRLPHRNQTTGCSLLPDRVLRLVRAAEHSDQNLWEGSFPVIWVVPGVDFVERDFVAFGLQHISHMAARVQHRYEVGIKGASRLEAAYR